MNLEITITKQDDKTVATLDGRLDTTTAPQLEQRLGEVLDETKALIVDLAALSYISSAGLRVLLSALKRMNAKGGSMVVRRANSLVMEIFEATGLVDVLTIED